MFGWLKRSVSVGHEPASTPDGMRLYAVGDIHGRADLLANLGAKIQTDAAEHPDKAALVIFLGDYVDRGPHSREVLDYLCTGLSTGLSTGQSSGATGLEQRCLMGNHEEAMLRFLSNPLQHADWLDYGGLETLVSYDVGYFEEDADALVNAADSLKAALPAHHLAFLQALEPWCELGDYLFVHAGIRPGVPLAAQNPEDLRWIRGAFLSYEQRHPRMVVHGHHVSSRVDVRSNRIGVDTGAYATGCLSCLVLDGTERFVLDTR